MVNDWTLDQDTADIAYDFSCMGYKPLRGVVYAPCAVYA
jgi:hypothetical protein